MYADLSCMVAECMMPRGWYAFAYAVDGWAGWTFQPTRLSEVHGAEVALVLHRLMSAHDNLAAMPRQGPVGYVLGGSG